MRLLKTALLPVILIASIAACAEPATERTSTSEAGYASQVEGLETAEGFFEVHEGDGKVLVTLPAPDEDGTLIRFIHAMRLTSGLGSNPIGLDRGWGNSGQIVRLRQVGDRVVAEVENHRYRATADNPLERQAVAQSLATSFIWSGPVNAVADDGRVLVDLTGLLTMDILGLADALAEEGSSFSLSDDLSMIEPGSVLAFPDNVEIDTLMTFTSGNPGAEVRATAPYPGAVTLGVHHSFVRLPDDGYVPRKADPRTGTFTLGFYDYSAPLNEEIITAWAMRHRLQRVDPADPESGFVEPIVFYIDPGAPEQIRDALVEGGSWWGDAFDAAGLEGAYRVELLPEDAHPLDVRYNVVQWVHRQTRGWSYGGGIIDPRTGEFIKGHVILGSQRVRQDRMIFEGLAGAGNSGSGAADDPVELSLARIRQLSAHEVAHALGFGHNFAASVNDRASVTDYPAPWVVARRNGTLDFSKTYDSGIGDWDKVTVEWLYGEFDPETEEEDLNAIIAEARDRGLLYIADQHGRSAGTMHPLAAVWDNGADPVAELENVMAVRRLALAGFDAEVLAAGRPQSALADVFTPVYLYHRYQVAAAAKTLGGAYYHYARTGIDGADLRIAPAAEQRRALAVLAETLRPSVLDIPESVLVLMQPTNDQLWFNVPSERLESRADPSFDLVAAVETAADLTLDAVLAPERAERLVQFHARDGSLPSLQDVFEALEDVVLAPTPDGRQALIADAVRGRYVFALMALDDGSTSQLVKARVRRQLSLLEDQLVASGSRGGERGAHDAWLADQITAHLLRQAPERALPVSGPDTPPGSPIGSYDTGQFVYEPCWHCE